jgi:hypothetical protein
MNQATAQRLIDEFGERSPGGLALARLLSLAVRVEPELMRKMRLALLPAVDASAEADLWFSPLVESYSLLALVLAPEVVDLLRQELAGEPALLGAAWEVIQEMHRNAPPALQLEEEVTWLALSAEPGRTDRIEQLLLSALAALRTDPSDGVAHWLARALPLLPQSARTSAVAQLLEMSVAGVLNLEFRLPTEVDGAVLHRWLPFVLPPDLPELTVGLYFTANGLEFGDPATPHAHSITLPRTDPLFVRLTWEEAGEPHTEFIRFHPGEPHSVTLQARAVELENAYGQRWQLALLADEAGALRQQPPIARTVYSLFAGIDHYPSPLRPLYGCVNDVQQMVAFLQERITGDPFQLVSHVLLNEAATKPAIMSALRDMAQQATAHDLFLFYFCGYGSQAPTLPRLAPLTPDGWDETLVCYDSRQPGGSDLTDRELNARLARFTAANCPAIVILDCSHGGAGTRPTPAPGDSIRRAPRAERRRGERIFLSFARGEEFTTAAAERLEKALAANGYELIPGVDAQQPGVDWQRLLSAAVDRADCAVVLLSPRSLASEFALNEIDWLVERTQEDSGFLLLPIALPGLDTAETPQSLSKVQIIHIEKQSEAAIDAAIATVLSALQTPVGVTVNRERPQRSWELTTGRQVLITACRPNEDAFELAFDGRIYGLLSYYLFDSLRRNSAASLRELMARVRTYVTARLYDQSPQLEANDTRDLDLPFLAGAIGPSQRYATVTFQPDRGWVIDTGALHGLPPVAGDETTLFALFDLAADLDEMATLSTALGQAEVQEVGPRESTVQITLNDGAAPDPGEIFKAVMIALPLPPLVLALEGDGERIEAVRKAILSAGPDGMPSLYIREGPLHGAALFLRAGPDGYEMRRAGDAYGLIRPAPGVMAWNVQLAVQRLEHIARWTQILTLTSPNNLVPTDAVRIMLSQVNAAGEEEPINATGVVCLQYELRDGQWSPPAFRIRLLNTSSLTLFCMVFDLTEGKAVQPLLGRGVWLEPGQEIALGGESPLIAYLPDELWEQGVTQLRDIIKLIVSTGESDATLLTQEDLPTQPSRAVAYRDSRRTANTLERLMRRVIARSVARRGGGDEAIVYWNSAEVTILTIRPRPDDEP